MTTTTRKTAKIQADSAKLAESLGNPETEVNPETGRKRAVRTTRATDPTGNGTPAGLRKRTTAKATAKPAAKKTAPKATAKATAKPTPKAPKADTAGMVRKSLAARLIQAAAAEFEGDNAEDQQKVANWLKIVTSGTDENGKRAWPTDILPRPTHFSWDA